VLGPHIFPDDDSGRDPRACPSCGDGRLSLKLGKFGAFVGCSNYPACRNTRPLVAADGDGEDGATPGDGPRVLGTAPDGAEVTLRKGPYGLYVQHGEGGDETKPKRTSLPKGMDPETVDLETALALLSLPREIGRHPETGETITAGIGRYGPYVKHADAYKSLKADDDVLTIGINRAVSLLAEPSRGRATPLRVLGRHPDDDQEVTLYDGRYGPYVKHNKINATLPKGADPDTFSLAQAVPLLAERAAKKGKPSAKAGAATGKARGRSAAGRGAAKKGRSNPARGSV
jgi:DNA topoisomerase-1